MGDDRTYKAAGVDIEAGYEAVARIRSLAKGTHGPQVLDGIGGFGGFFALGKDHTDPVLVAGADGVGTKLKIAFQMDRHDTIGIDAVAYCVNDILCHLAKPLFFLDYLAVGRLDPQQVEAVVAGVAAGCREAGCALLGGETAEMPGFYPPGEYDLAGFAVGLAERAALVDGGAVRPGDAIVGLASTGLQSSGYSLVRRVLLEELGLGLDEHFEELGRTLGEELLQPTGIYVGPIFGLAEAVEVRGIANITGGGLPENLPRALASGCRARLYPGSWEMPAIFPFLQERGAISPGEMYATFNMGLGMVVVVPPTAADAAVAYLRNAGQAAWIVGEVIPGEPGVEFDQA